MNTLKDFKLGADPEFLVIRPDNSPFRSENYRGFRKIHNRRLSGDGGGILFEVHPSPSENPFQIVDSVREILKGVQNDPQFSNKKIVASTYDMNIHVMMGGHIHFGGAEVRKIINYFMDYHDAPKCIYYLSNYLGYVTSLIDSNSISDRVDRGYGDLLDYRPQRHGLEYRSPSTWLSSPEYATTVLCLSKVVMFEYLNFDNVNFNKESLVFDPDDDYSYTNSKGLYIKDTHFKKVWKKIQSMKLYPLYADYLDVIPKMVKDKLTFNTNLDIFQSWQLK